MPEAALLKTPLHAWHKAHGGRLVEFGGWEMPVQYSTIVEEHTAVRERVGLFDISHMGRLSFDGHLGSAGHDALASLNFATTNDVARLKPTQIQYSLMVDHDGGVIDDVLVYRLPDGRYSMVCNASNRGKVVAQLRRILAGFDTGLDDQTERTAMIAVQGPRAAQTLGRILYGSSIHPFEDIRYYTAFTAEVMLAYADCTAIVSRTGYTGEDGFELIVPAEHAESTWAELMTAGRDFGILPIGLGARDTLRFEAGMPLYGHEMDETINPYAAGLGWAVKLNKGEFVGRDALRKFKANPGMARVGLELEGKRIARQGCPVTREGRAVGAVTSGTFAPTLGKSLAMALVEPGAAAVGTALVVDVRGRDEPARVVPLPFYRRPGAGKNPAGPSPSPVGA